MNQRLNQSFYSFSSRCILLALLLLVGCKPGNQGGHGLLTHPDGNVTSYQLEGEGEAIVFIHAGGLNKAMWRAQVNVLGHDFKVLTYDVRGHGDSDFVQNERTEVADLVALLDHLSIEKIKLVGCSLGAIIALDFALKYPDRLEKLVLISPGLVGVQEKDPVYLAQLTSYVNALQQADTAAVIQQLKILNAFGKNERELPQAMGNYLQQSLAAFVNSPGLVRPVKLENSNPMEVIPELKVSSLLITGTLDHDYILHNARVLEETLPKAQYRPVSAAGHLPNLEQADQLNALLIEFFKQ